MEEKKYPVHIIPNDGWSLRIPCEAILKNDSDAIIGRRILGSPDKYLDFSLGEDEPILKDKWIDKHELPNLSTSLLGAMLKLGDFQVIQKGEGDLPWKGGNVDFDKFKEGKDYVWVEGLFFILGWKIIDLEDKTLPYTQVFPKENDYSTFTEKHQAVYDENKIFLEEYKKLERNDNKLPYLDLEGSININHDPKNLNYWHFTIDMYPFDTAEPLVDTKKSWSKAMALSFKDILSQTFLCLNIESEINEIKGWEDFIRLV